MEPIHSPARNEGRQASSAAFSSDNLISGPSLESAAHYRGGGGGRGQGHWGTFSPQLILPGNSIANLRGRTLDLRSNQADNQEKASHSGREPEASSCSIIKYDLTDVVSLTNENAIDK